MMERCDVELQWFDYDPGSEKQIEICCDISILLGFTYDYECNYAVYQ